MNNPIKNLVNKYESILEFKENNKMNIDNRKYYIHNFASVLLILTVFLLVGYILGLNQNFNYVAFSINAAIFGSFLFVKIMKERQYQLKEKKKYNVYESIFMDMLQLAVIQSAVTAILFYFVYPLVVNNITIVITAMVATILLILYFILTRRFKYVREIGVKTPVYIVIIHQFYMIGFKVFVVESLLWSAIIWTSLLLAVLGIQDVLTKRNSSFVINIWIKMLLYISVLTLVSSLYIGDSRVTNYVQSIPILEEETTFFHVPEVKYYPFLECYVGEGFIRFGVEDNSIYFEQHFNVFKNAYLNSSSIIFVENQQTFIETISKKTDGFHYVIYEYRNNLLEEITHTIEDTEPLYQKEASEYDIPRLEAFDLVYAWASKDFVYFKSEVGIVVYSKDFNFINIIPTTTEGWSSNVIVNDSITYLEEPKTYHEGSESRYSTTLYAINTDGSIELVLNTPNMSERYSFLYSSGTSYYYEKENKIYEYNITDNTFSYSSGSPIRYQDGNKVVMSNGGLSTYRIENEYGALYSNGYLATFTRFNSGINITPLQDLMNNIDDNIIHLKSEQETTKQDFSRVSFIATENRFVIIDLNYITTYDKEGNFVEQLPFYDDKNSNRTLIDGQSLLSVDYVYGLGAEEPTTYSVNSLNSDDISKIVMRKGSLSTSRSTNPYGYHKDKSLGETIYIDIQFIIIVALIIVPSFKNSKENILNR